MTPSTESVTLQELSYFYVAVPTGGPTVPEGAPEKTGKSMMKGGGGHNNRIFFFFFSILVLSRSISNR